MAAESHRPLHPGQAQERRLKPAPPADRRTLIRRATFDLTGLPPAPEEIDAFLADPSPRAFETLVERLLASRHYGERWGRHWLDVVRYADTSGCSADFPVPEAFRYRNYVIDAFNRDKPYDRFLREQIAGDLLPHASESEKVERLIATGYIAISRRFGTTPENYLHLTIEDTIENLGRALLGLGLGCARCHDHKFDPIPTEDYYALYGIFRSTRYSWGGYDNGPRRRDLVPLIPQEEADALRKEFEERKSVLEKELERVSGELKAARKEAPSAAAAKRAKELEAAVADAKQAHDRFVRNPPLIESAYAVAEGKAQEARVHVRGDPNKLGPEVPRGFLQVLGGPGVPAKARGSGRLELAEWLTDPRNPLTARVMVNRLWQHHFGKGLVATPNDFGRQGLPPTHPELLDYLAERFVEQGWSIKAMHRLIMNSSTYRLSGRDLPENLEVDPENALLWKFSRRRLDAEAVRDAILAASGELDRTMGGAHPFPPQSTWAFVQERPFAAAYETRRRSVYVMQPRIKMHPFFQILDGADPRSSTGARLVGHTPLQALFFMNDPFVHEQADRFADRLMGARPEPGGRVKLAFLLALGRPPRPEEERAALTHVREAQRDLKELPMPEERRLQLAWASLARALLSSHEFIFIE